MIGLALPCPRFGARQYRWLSPLPQKPDPQDEAAIRSYGARLFSTPEAPAKMSEGKRSRTRASRWRWPCQPYALAAVAATGNAESRFDPANANRTWSDPAASGHRRARRITLPVACCTASALSRPLVDHRLDGADGDLQVRNLAQCVVGGDGAGLSGSLDEFALRGQQTGAEGVQVFRSWWRINAAKA